MATFKIEIKDYTSSRKPNQNKITYVRDFDNKATSNRFPMLSIIGVPLDIKKLLDSKSMNLMDLLNISKLKDKISVSDLIGLLSVQSIVSDLVNMNQVEPIYMSKRVPSDRPSSNPKLTDDIYGRRLYGAFKVENDSYKTNCADLLSLWDACRNENNEDLKIFYEANIDPFLHEYNESTYPSDIVNYYNSYLMDEISLCEATDYLPYRFILGTKTFNSLGDYIVPIFLILEPGSGKYLSVRENYIKFFSEYVKIHYGFMPIQTVSSLDTFKKYFEIL